MTELDNRVQITVQIQDTVVTRAGFGILAIVHQHQESALAAVETYTDLTSLLAVFPSFTPVGTMANIVYSQAFVPESVKVIKRGAAETMTVALDAALLVDSDFYGVITPSKVNADIEAGAAWALANKRLFGYSSPDPNSIIADVTDPFSVIQALSNNRAAGWYSDNAGGEFTIDTITVASTTATADLTGFGSVPVEVGDTVGIWSSVVPELNALWIVDTIGATEFTFTVPAGTTSDVAASDAWFDGNWLEGGIFGKMLPQDAGSRTWDIQNLAAVTADNIPGTAQTNLGGKNGNWFSTIGGVNVTSGPKPGGGGKTASGRYIDVQRGADWLSVNLQADLFALMVNEGGDLGYDAIGFQKVETTIATRLNDGLDKGFLTPFVSGQFAGQDWNIVMPNLADIPQADKTNRLLAGIQIDALIRGKIHNMEATLTLAT